MFNFFTREFTYLELPFTVNSDDKEKSITIEVIANYDNKTLKYLKRYFIFNKEKYEDIKFSLMDVNKLKIGIKIDSKKFDYFDFDLKQLSLKVNEPSICKMKASYVLCELLDL